MCDRFDQRGFLVRQRFGAAKRDVAIIPGEVKTRTWRFAGGVAVQAQSLSDAHEWLDAYLEKIKTQLNQGMPHGAN